MKLHTTVLLGALLATSACAADSEYSSDTFNVNIGSMFVTDFETDMQIGQEGVPLGAKINTKDQLGMESETSVFRMDGYYRFNKKHSIGFSYYAVKSDSSRYVPGQIEWDGDTISDALIESYFDMTIYELYYGYSFYHNPDVELQLTAGVHVTEISLGLSAKGTVNGVTNTFVSSAGAFTAPLPVFGFKGVYFIVPDTLFISYAAQYFFIQIDDYKGSFVSNMFTLDYRFTKHFGAGVGLNTNTLSVERKQGGTTVDATNVLNGAMLYLSVNY